MENLKVKELREIARSRGLKGWYRLRKSDLISFIMEKEEEDSDRRSEEITQGSGLRKATPSDQKPEVSNWTKSESSIHNKVIYNKGTMYSDQKSKVSDRKSEEIIQGSGLRKTTPKDTKYLDPGAEKEPNLEEKRKARRRAKKARYRANRRARKEQELEELEDMRRELEEESNRELRIERTIAKLQESESTDYFTLRYLLLLKGY